MDVEPGLVLRVEGPEYFGELAADLVVVLRQVVQAPLTQLESVVNLEEKNHFFFAGTFQIRTSSSLGKIRLS